MKVIVLTGGGSSGHVTPNVALIPELQQYGYAVHYIGSINGRGLSEQYQGSI